jgi:O-antigen ligase
VQGANRFSIVKKTYEVPLGNLQPLPLLRTLLVHQPLNTMQAKGTSMNRAIERAWVPIVCAMVLLPGWIATGTIWTGHDAARLLQWACALGAAIVIFWRAAFVSLPSSTIPPPLSSRALLVWVCAGFLIALSVYFSDQPKWAGREIAVLLGVASVAWVVAAGTRIRPFGVVVYAPTFCVAIYSLAVLLLLSMVFMTQVPLLMMELFPGFENYRFFNHMQTVALPLCLLGTWSGWGTKLELERWGRRIAWFALVTSWALLIFTTGRATLVGVGVATILAALLFGSLGRQVAKRMMIAAGAGWLLYVLLFWALPKVLGIPLETPVLQQIQQTQSIEMRLMLWQLAWTNTIESPWWGIGPMHYAHRINVEAAHPHNVVMQLLSEWGIPLTLLAAACALGWMLRFTSKLRQLIHYQLKPLPAPFLLLGIVLWMSVTGALIDGQFSGNFVMPVSQMWIAMVIGWALGWHQWVTSTQQQTPTSQRDSFGLKMRRVMASLTLIAAQVGLAWSIAPEVKNIEATLEQSQKKSLIPARYQPRFWVSGWF